MEFPSDRERLLVEMFYQTGDSPFICGVLGHATLDALQEMETDVAVNADEYFTKGDGTYLFDATSQPGQYGEFGRCEILPHWELELLLYRQV